MKVLLLSAILLFSTIQISKSQYSQNSQKVQISERLAVKMRTLNPLEYTRVLIVLKDRIDIEQLDKDLYEMKAPLQYRAETVITTLRNKAAETQGPILAYLNAEKSSGKIKQMISYWITNMIFIEATPDVLDQLTKRTDVDIMDLDAELDYDRPYDQKPAVQNSESVESGLRIIKADSLWMIGITGAGRTVMNIDGGVNGTHPALSGKWWGNNGRQWYHSWFDPIAPVSTSPFDCSTHGTHTMGIMCGSDNITGDTVGVAPDAFWMAAGVTDCPGASYPSMNIAAYQWAIDPDTNAVTMDMPDVISCSWRDPTATDECTSSIYRTVLPAVEAAGIAVVFSAGNSGPSASTITPPKNINLDSVNTFCVGNLNGSTMLISSSSSRGPSICGGSGTLLIKPEVCAPGTSIRSTWSGTSYGTISGTSMAAPHVAGCIALLKQAAPGMTGKELKAILFSTATDLGAAGEDNTYGKGLVNVYKAYQMLGPSITHTPITNTEDLTGPYVVNSNITTAQSGIDPSETKLFWSRNNPSITDSLVMTNSGGNNWTANIPGNNTNATYRYYIKTADSLGKTSVSPPGAPANLYSFNAEMDNMNPVIVHSPLGDQAKLNWPVSVGAVVTDNIGVDSTWVRWYKNSSGSGIKHFRLNNTGGDDYSSLFNSINSEVNIGDKIYYKIFAIDNSLSQNSDSTSLYSFNIIDVYLCEGFTSGTFPPADWSIENTGTTYWTRNGVSSYGTGSGSAKFDFWSATSGNTQSLITLTFGNSVAGDSLSFDHAYAPYTNGTTDSLEILTSSDGGTNYSRLVQLWGNNSDGNLNTRAQSGSAYTPLSNEWATKKYSLPVGTNKIKFRARSGYGNNLYLDSICLVNSSAAVASNITFIQEGFYNTATNMLNMTDTVRGYLRNVSSPFNIVDSGKALLDSISFSAQILFPEAVTGTYYIQLKHRNTLETWSKSGGESYTRGVVFNYDFTTALTQAYGSNQIIKNSKSCVFSGDIQKNGFVDLSDITSTYNDANTFATGYVNTDLTGNSVTDLDDLLIAYNNSANFVEKITP